MRVDSSTHSSLNPTEGDCQLHSHSSRTRDTRAQARTHAHTPRSHTQRRNSSTQQRRVGIGTRSDAPHYGLNVDVVTRRCAKVRCPRVGRLSDGLTGIPSGPLLPPPPTPAPRTEEERRGLFLRSFTLEVGLFSASVDLSIMLCALKLLHGQHT